MFIQLKDGRMIEAGKVKKEKRIDVSVGAKKYYFDSFLIQLSHSSKYAGSADLRRPAVIYGYPVGRHVGEVGYFVSKSFRGSGLSYLMLHEIAKFALSHGMKLILMSTTTDNKSAVMIFKNCGGKISADFEGVMKEGKSVIWMSAAAEDIIKKSRLMWIKKGVQIVRS